MKSPKSAIHVASALACLLAAAACGRAADESPAAPTIEKASAGNLWGNLVPNGDFQRGKVGGLPDGWQIKSALPGLTPVFRLVDEQGQRQLLASGNGNADCVGYVTTQAPIARGRTYRFHTRFRISEGMNPQENLLFQAIGPGARDGIFKFKRLAGGRAEGDAEITYPGRGAATAEVRIYFRLSARGKAWIKDIALTETRPTPPRWVKVACTNGDPNLRSAEAVLEAAGRAKADLVLLPEYVQGGLIPEPFEGPSCRLMAALAKKHRMYVVCGIVRKAEPEGRLYNTAVIFDRQGKLLGTYDKHHPYSPELNDEGITPGTGVPVFRTDFGKVGVMICYDSWFPDVAELLSLKGAEIILFPNVGYYRSLMPARAADNGVRIVASSYGSGNGVWDTAGRSVVQPLDADPTVLPIQARPTFKDVSQIKVGKIELLLVSLDLESSPSPAYNGGTMMSAPGGRRNRCEQKTYLEDEIRRERQRWWTE